MANKKTKNSGNSNGIMTGTEYNMMYVGRKGGLMARKKDLLKLQQERSKISGSIDFDKTDDITVNKFDKEKPKTLVKKRK